jgi:hypothetical protein
MNNIFLDIETIPCQRADIKADLLAAVKAPATYKKAALTIIHYLKHQGLLEKKRKELYKSDTIISWDNVAQKWLDYMKRV